MSQSEIAATLQEVQSGGGGKGLVKGILERPKTKQEQEELEQMSKKDEDEVPEMPEAPAEQAGNDNAIPGELAS